MDFSIVKVPLRIPIAGGGTDIPDFTKHYEGYCISAAIDKYIYVIIKKNILSNKYHLKYSKTEKINVKIIKCVVNSFCIIVSPLDKFKKIIEIIVIIELIANCPSYPS